MQVGGGAVSAGLSGASLAGHAVSIAVVDSATGEPIALDEQGKTVSGDTVTVPIPARTSVPEHPRAYVIVDGYAFPRTTSTARGRNRPTNTLVGSMRVLLTNDDGIEAEGLQALRRALREVPGIELAVIAPDGNR